VRAFAWRGREVVLARKKVFRTDSKRRNAAIGGSILACGRTDIDSGLPERESHHLEKGESFGMAEAS
jgi:hypothetical protein